MNSEKLHRSKKQAEKQGGLCLAHRLRVQRRTKKCAQKDILILSVVQETFLLHLAVKANSKLINKKTTGFLIGQSTGKGAVVKNLSANACYYCTNTTLSHQNL